MSSSPPLSDLAALEQAGDLAHDTHANARAIAFYDRALVRAAGGDPACRLRLMLKKGRLLELSGAWDAGAMLAGEAADLAETMGDPASLAAARDLRGFCRQHLGQYAEATADFDQALALYRAAGDAHGQIEVLSHLGKTAFLQSRYAEAGAHYGEQLDLAEALGEPAGIARALGNLGNLHLYQDELDLALDCYARQLDLAEQASDEREMAVSLGNMGIAYRRRLDFPAALGCYQRKLALTERIGDKEGLAISHGNIGVLRWYQGDYEGAAECCLRQLEIVQELGDQRSLAAVFGNLGDLYKELGDLDRSEDFYDRALNLCDALDLRYYRAYYTCNKADLCLRRGRLRDALALVEVARDLAEVIGDEETRFNSRVLAARIQGEATRSPVERDAAIADLEILAREVDVGAGAERDERLAVVHAALYRLTGDTAHALAGEARYRALFARTGNQSQRALADGLAAVIADRGEPAPFGLIHCVGEACNHAAAEAAHPSLRLSYTVDHAVPAWVVGDEGRLRDALGQMLRYGVAHAGVGGLRLAISVVRPGAGLDSGTLGHGAVPGTSGSNGLVLRFGLELNTPSTPGLPQAMMASPTPESISRDPVVAAAEAGGVGALNLDLWARLVRALGGRIELADGGGTAPVLAFSLPVIPAPAPETGLPTVPPPATDAMPIIPQPIDPTLGRRLPLRILVAEDDEVSRQVLLRALEKMGYAADTAADGESAIERIKQSGYDLVFMDIHMPRLDGLAATRRIAIEIPETTRPYIVATTASVMQNARRQCLDAGMDDYLAKPLRVRQLQDAIVRAAGERAAGEDR